MSIISVLALVGSAGLVTAHPFSISPRADVAAFPAGSSWDIILNHGGDTSSVESVADDNFQVIDIDLFDTSKETIADLKATKRVICYFSAGTREDWREDAKKFKQSDTKNAVSGGPDGEWPGELWVDVTSENVRSIMKARIEKAAAAGCDAIDPDNVDGFDNQTGFNHPKSKYVEYIKFMAQIAKDNKMAIGLKNAVDMIPELVDTVHFAVNEQCHEYQGECAKYKPFTQQNKAVFNIEYGGNKKCESPAGVKLSTLIKSDDQALNALGGACPGQGAVTPTPVESEVPAGSSAASVPSKPSPTAVIPKPTPTTTTPKPTPTATTPVEDDGEGDEEEDNEEDDKGKNHKRPPGRHPKYKPYRWGWRGGRWN